LRPALTLALLVTACAQIDKADAPLPLLKGQTVASVAAKLGDPEQQDGALVWTMETRAPVTPVPSTRVSYASGVPNKIETLSYPDPPRVETCTLRVVADGAGTIASNEWQGSRAGCYAMSRKLTSP
jgi:hypothetical protein